MKNSYFIIGFLVILASINFSDAQQKCTKAFENKADIAFGEMVILGDHKTSWPTNDNELQVLCDHYKINDKITKDYVRTCLNGLSQQIINMLLKGAHTMSKRFCGKNPDRKLFEHTVCGNSDNEHDHICMDKYVQMTKNSLNLVDVQRLPGACCAYNKFESCVLNRMSKEPLCTPEAISFFKKQIKAIAGEALDFTCTDYRENPDKCIPIIKKIEKSNKELAGKSLLIPLSEVMKSLTT